MKAIFGGKIGLTVSRLADSCVRAFEAVLWKIMHLVLSTILWLVLNISEGVQLIKRLCTAKNQA